MPEQTPNSMEAQTETQDILALIRAGGVDLGQIISICGQLQSAGQVNAAINLYGLWLQHTVSPQRHVALFNLGAMLQSESRHEEAIIAYRAARQVLAWFAEPAINEGLALEAIGRDDEALECWRAFLDQHADEPQLEDSKRTMLLNHIGRLHEEHKRYVEAEDALAKSAAIDPHQVNVLHHWVHIRQKACHWPAMGELKGVSANALLMATSPLAMLALTDDPVQQLLTAHAYVGRTFGFEMEHLCAGRKYQHDRLRIGFVSGDLCTHAVGVLLPELLEGFNKNRFELYAYDYSVEDGTALRQRLIAAFDQFRSIKSLSDRQVANQVLDDEIDVLFDMHGLSSGARPRIFALRPAPVQVAYLGYIGTTAMPWIDYVVADRACMPQELTPYFSEKPLYVDGSFIPIAPFEPNQSPPKFSREQLGLPTNGQVFASFGNVYKINRTLALTWAGILKESEESVLWLVDDNPVTTENLKQFFKSEGLGEDRVLFQSRTGFQDYQERLRLVDVFLDTFPYNCGSTARDVVRAGVPMVTLAGRSMVSRMGLSLSGIFPSLIATGQYDEYLNAALTFVKTDRSECTRIRCGTSALIADISFQLQSILSG